MRLALGIVAGVIVALLWALDVNNPADHARLMEAMPRVGKVMVLAAWFVGALVGAWVANWVARRRAAGWVVALLVIAAGVGTLIMKPHPGWMWAGGILLPLLGAFIADKLSPRDGAEGV